MQNVITMSDEQFAAHMAAKQATLDQIGKGIADLRGDLAQIIERLDELLQPQRDEAERQSYRLAGSPNG